MGSRLGLKCGEENSGRRGVGSMKDAMPPSTSGSRAGSSRGAEGAAGRPDISDGEAGVRTGIVQGTVRGPDVLASYSRRRVGHPPGICSRGCKTRERNGRTGYWLSNHSLSQPRARGAVALQLLRLECPIPPLYKGWGAGAGEGEGAGEGWLT